MNEQQKQTMEALRQRVLQRCKETPQRVSKFQLRQLIREEWEKMQAESKQPSSQTQEQ